jgi:hypothetical protein
MDRLFTPEILGTLAGAVIAVRLIVEYTKEYVDQWTGGKLPTFFYAVLVAYVAIFGSGAILHGLGNGMWFAHLFNGPLIAVVAGIMQKDKPPQG